MFKTIKLDPEFMIVNGPPTRVFGGVDLKRESFNVQQFKKEFPLMVEYALEPISLAYDVDIEVDGEYGSLLVKIPKEAKPLDNYIQLDLSGENNEFANVIRNLDRNKNAVDCYKDKENGTTYLVYDLEQTFVPIKVISFVQQLHKVLVGQCGLEHDVYSRKDEKNIIIESQID
jgi:hypothetical protein